MEQWRTSLRALGIKLAVVSVCSFACKAVLVALEFFGVVAGGSSLYLSLSTLLVEALPSILTIALLIHYHIGIIGAARGSSDIGVSLLTRDASSSAHSSFTNINITGEPKFTLQQANIDQDRESWLLRFVANGRVLGMDAHESGSTETREGFAPEQAKSDVDDESWLAQFMAKGRVMGAAARTSRGAGLTVN